MTAYPLTLITEYEGPVCAAWVPDSGLLCEHDSCWDVMSLGGSAFGRAVAADSPPLTRARRGYLPS